MALDFDPRTSAPLLPMQEAILFDCALFGGHDVYTVEIPVRCTGHVDLERLSASVQTAARRHVALRLRTPAVEGGATGSWIQSWNHPCELSSDLGPLTRRPVDPEREPPISIGVESHGPHQTSLVIRFHHVAVDRAAVEMFIEDFIDIYVGKTPEPCGDYADALATLLDHVASAESVARESSAPNPRVSARLTRRSAGDERSFVRVARASTAVPRALCSTLAARAGVTMQSVVLASYAGTLARLGPNDDVVIGIPVSLRDVLPQPRTAGCFMSVVPVAIRVDPNERLTALARRVSASMVEHLERRWQPLLNRHGSGGSPATTHSTVLSWAERRTIVRRGLRVELGGPRPYPARLDASLLAELDGDSLLLDLDYDPDGLSAAEAGARLDCIRTMLGASEAAEPTLVHVPLAHAQRGPEPEVPDVDMLAAITANMAASPEAIAVIEPSGRVHRYGDLRDASDRIVGWALELRAGPVGLALPRSFEMVAALVGLLRAGRSVVLLDGDDPAGLRAAQRAVPMSCVLADQPNPSLPNGLGIPAILDGRSPDRSRVTDAITSESMVIVLTSGTTGVPKPVMLPLRTLARHADWARRRFELTPADRVLQFCSVAFDAMLEEVLPTLAAGASLGLADAFCSSSGAALVEHCTNHEITVVDLPTGFFNLAVGALARERSAVLPASLRLVVIGGEAYSRAAIAAWRELVQRSSEPPKLLTTYGPAEATVVVAAEDPSEDNGQLALVGQARPGARLYVLDRWLQPCPEGIVGELHIGGDVLATGYLGAPAATAHKLVPDPWSTRPGARMVRTGDLVVRLHGELRYVGRLDHQVKLRGVRVELAGVEAVLSRAFGGTCAVVAVNASTDAGPLLVAFVDAERRPNTRRRCEEAVATLPPAARPALVEFEQLPLNGRGKVDRDALSRRATSLLQATHSEQKEATVLHGDLIARAIGTGSFAPHDDFFAVGGHSLAVLYLISLVRETLGVTIDVRGVFEARTISRISALIAEASPAPAGRVERRGDDHVLGSLEEAMCLDDRLTEGPSAYRIREQWSIEPPLDRERLRRAVTVVLGRHPILRARVVTDGESLRWRPLPPLEALAQVMPADDADHSEPPKIGLRLSLIERGTEQILQIDTHHAVLDGRGLTRLLRDLAAAYTERQTELTVHTRLPSPFTTDERVIEAWRRQLAGIGVPPQLEPDVRPSQPNGTLAVQVVRSIGLFADALAVSSHGPVAFLAAAVSAWLHRTTHAQDLLVFLAVVADEGQPELRVSTTVLPIRSRPSPRQSFASHLDATRDTLSWILDHRRCGVRDIARILRSETGQHVPLGVLVDVQSVHDVSILQFGEARASLRPTVVETVRADLEVSLRISSRGTELELVLRGRQGLYSEQALAGWAESLVELTRAFGRDPSTSLDGVPLISITSPVVALCSTTRIPGLAPVPEQLRRMLMAKGSTVVAADSRTTVTGAEAARLADATMACLLDAGVEPGAKIQCELTRSVNHPSILLGIWQAGAVPVLVNPDHPPARRQAMREHIEPALTISDSREGSNEGIVTLASLVAAAAEAWALGPSRVPPPEAYIAFTSGSTGIPRPVVCGWSGLEQLLAWSGRNVPMTEHDALLHTAAPGFDIAIWEMLHPLLQGARLIVAPRAGLGDIGGLIELCDTWRCTHLHLVPSLLEAFLDALGTDEGRSLAVILCGGDLTSAALYRRLLETRGLPMWHCYGPTEATVFSLAWLGDRPSSWADRLPLGAPVAGSGVAILDANGNPVVRGVVGELGIFGESLALGYAKMPIDTALRFRPFAGPSGPGGRIYLTGDRARMLPDGSLEYRGRTDRQVKVAGVRIELDEVELALMAASEVRHAVVIAHGGRLAAYVVPLDPHLDHALVRQAATRSARARLPAVAVPHPLVVVDHVPLTEHGKVDRSRLSEQLDRTDQLPAAPETSVLARLWCEALECENAGWDEDFFGRGGDSMTAIRLCAAARRHGIEITLADVFRHPTIRRLQAAVEAREASVPSPAAVAAGTVLELRSAARRWLERQRELDGGVQSLLLRSTHPLERDEFRRAWTTVLRRHDALYLRIDHGDDGWRVRAGSSPESVDVPLATDDDDAQALARSLVDPRMGIMAGAALVASDPHVFAIAVHHLAVDWQSWSEILTDLWQAHAGSLAPRPAPSFAALARARSDHRDAGWIATPPRPRRRRIVVERELGGSALASLEASGRKRTALLVAATGEAIARLVGRAEVRLELEIDGRDDNERARGVVGWLTEYRPVSLVAEGRLHDAWLAEAERALTDAPQSLPPFDSERCDYVLNIVPESSMYSGPFSVVSGEREHVEPAHAVAIEFELSQSPQVQSGVLTIDCDERAPVEAEALATAILRALQRSPAQPRRIPATPLQEAMVLECLRRPDARLYHSQIVFSLDGLVDIQRLRSAWLHAVRVHDAFRSRINPYAPEGPMLEFETDALLVWRERTGGDVERALEEAMQADLAEPFELATGPLSRLTLVEARGHLRLLWSHHHALFDGWSLNVVVRTVADAYAALESGGSLRGPAPSLAELALWWHANSTAMDADIRYWVDMLDHAAPPVALASATDAEHRGAVTHLKLSAERTHHLTRHGLARKITLHEVVLTGWTLVLSRQTRMRDITFGIVVALRPAEIRDVANIVGLLMNMVPFRVQLPDALDQLVATVRSSLTDALAHPRAPLARILAGLRERGREGWAHGLRTAVIFENYPGDRGGAPLGLHGRLRTLDAHERSEVPLVLVALPGRQLRFELLHDRAEETRQLASRLLSQLDRILTKLTTAEAAD